MPLYEYRCRQCQHDFEELVFSKEESVACPECEGATVEKKLSLPGQPVVKSLPVRGGCDTSGPPCSPQCCRL